MSFKVAARTVLELGAELISSDAIAIYELVKNAFDAGSPSVRVDVRVVLRRSTFEKILDTIDDDGFETPEDALNELLTQIDDGVDPDLINGFVEDLTIHEGLDAFRDSLSSAYVDHNYIRVSDTGSGMSLDKLSGAFLTIGTANRVLAGRTREDGKRMLGEKGVGRLSAMRLGSKLRVRTGQVEDRHWSILEIDWNDFARDPEQMIEDVAVEARRGAAKTDPSAHGTTLTIRDLTSDWSMKSLRELAAAEFSRLVDPFRPASESFPIAIRFNAQPVETDRISSILFKNAHGYCKAAYRIETLRRRSGSDIRRPRLTVEFDYRTYSERKTFDLGPSELRDALGHDVPEGALIDLGPFDFEFYWYNRRLLTGLDGIGKQQDVRKLVNAWSGGLMVFRDGFRVNPYGGPGDDWLDLNTQAFRSDGYLLNTDQIIGRLEISSENNPRLIDQTNREGLRDTFEKQALERVLHQFITVHLKRWMDSINEAYQGLKQLDLKDVEANVERYEKRVTANLKELRERFPGEGKTVTQLAETFADMKVAFTRAKGKADATEKDRQRLMDLAGIGLMVEIVAHELARATKHTLDLLASSRRRSDVPPTLQPLLDNLSAQMGTIDRRLRVLDPLSVSGRNRRTEFDLTEVVLNSFSAREAELKALGVHWSVTREDGGKGGVWVKAARGMVVQIVENLLSNSLYWLGKEKSSNSRFRPEIRVHISPDHKGGFTFMDNGPGIAPQAADRVFDAFFTTRRGEGRGLGLYISRENARYFGGDLVLSQERPVHPDRLNIFQFLISTAA